MIIKLRLFIALTLISLATVSLPAYSSSTADVITPTIHSWIHLSQNPESLPYPSQSLQQTASLVLDIDQDGVDDFVIGARKEPGPSLV